MRRALFPARPCPPVIARGVTTPVPNRAGGKRARSLVLVLVLVLAACGPAVPDASPRPVGPTPSVTVPFELPIVLAIAGRFADQEVSILDEQIAAFEADNPGVRVEVVAEPRDDADRRQTMLDQLAEGDTSRDILLLNTTWLAEFAAGGWLLPLDGYVRSHQVAMGDFLPSTVQAATLDGRLMALPWTADGGFLYYRLDLLDRYGYEPPATWADLQRLALEIQAQEGLPYGFVWQGAANESLTCNTLEFVWAHGGEVLDEGGRPIFDGPETRAALQQMVDLITSGVSPADMADFRETASLTAFEEGEAVFMRNWFYAWDRLESDTGPRVPWPVGVAPLPASCLGGQSLALSAHSLHPEQAFRLMAFLTRFDQQVQIANMGVQPPALATIYPAFGLRARAHFLRQVGTMLSTARPRPQVAAYPQVSEAIYTEVNRMLAGEQDAATTAANVQRRLEAILR